MKQGPTSTWLRARGIDSDHPRRLRRDRLANREPAAVADSTVAGSQSRRHRRQPAVSSFPICPRDAGTGRRAQARLVPIARQGQEKPVGVFIAALNPYRQFDSSYDGFLDLVAGQIAASITNAEAYEEEKKARRRVWPSWTAPRRPSSAT